MDSPSLIMASRIGRSAASVFPVPVGAISRAFFPALTIGTSFSCGSVGDSKPRSFRAATSGGQRSWKAFCSAFI
jgi:hypothetical protein